MSKFHLVSILSLFIWVAAASARQAPPRHDDPFGRMCYELQREGICSEPCDILPPNCISGEEAARRRACAIGQLNGTLDPNCKPIVLPTPPGAPDENLAIAAQVRGGTMYWNLWTTCKSCGFSL